MIRLNLTFGREFLLHGGRGGVLVAIPVFLLIRKPARCKTLGGRGFGL